MVVVWWWRDTTVLMGFDDYNRSDWTVSLGALPKSEWEEQVCEINDCDTRIAVVTR